MGQACRIVCYFAKKDPITAFMTKVCPHPYLFEIKKNKEEVVETFKSSRFEDDKLLFTDLYGMIHIPHFFEKIKNLKVILVSEKNLGEVIQSEGPEIIDKFTAIEHLTKSSEADQLVLKNYIHNLYTHGNISLTLENAFNLTFNYRTLQKSSDTYSILEQVESYLEVHKVKKFQRLFYLDALTELIANAVFDAPITEKGDKKYYNIDRRRNIELEIKEGVQVKWGIDDKFLICQVVDHIGSLKLEHIFGTLRRCHMDETKVNLNKNEGGGVGFYKILNATTHILVNVLSNKKTEFTCILDRNLTKQQIRDHPKSLFFNINHS